ncbi:MAG: GGDEF domain-containing protein [Hydrogenothermaceae bacterium]|nr:GGDEF domain-containing protein [Hydrogenothermaceae bacterium]
MIKIRNLLLRYPIKYTFLVILLITAILSSIVIILIDIKISTSSIRREELEESLIISDNIFQLSEYLLNKGDVYSLQKILTTYSAHADIDEINITDKEKRIILSTKRSNIGNIEKIPNFEGCRYTSITKIDCHFTIESKENYHLIIRYDISDYLKDYGIKMIKKYMIFLFIFALTIEIINLAFFNLIGEKIEKIVRYLKEIKSGTKINPLHIYGRNELSIIADSITDAYKRLWELINLDRLTKIPNRFYLEKEFSKHKNHISKVKFLAIIDLDNFKELNDFFGHDFGDRVLMEFAKKLENICEGYSYICGRLGGDEFLVFGCEEDSSKIENYLWFISL